MTDRAKKTVTLSKAENEFLTEFLKTSSKSKFLSYTQTMLIELANQAEKSDDDIREMKTLIKAEKLVKDKKEKSAKNAVEVEKAISSVIVKSIKSGDMFNDTISYKEILQKMIDNGKFENTAIFADLLKKSPVPVVIVADTDKSDNNAPVVDVVEGEVNKTDNQADTTTNDNNAPAPVFENEAVIVDDNSENHDTAPNSDISDSEVVLDDEVVAVPDNDNIKFLTGMENGHVQSHNHKSKYKN